MSFLEDVVHDMKVVKTFSKVDFFSDYFHVKLDDESSKFPDLLWLMSLVETVKEKCAWHAKAKMAAPISCFKNSRSRILTRLTRLDKDVCKALSL